MDARTLQPVRGMNDVLAEDMPYWQFLEQAARDLLGAYGYQEVRVPLVEHTELFKRSIGEFTDIVEKEMYTFPDRGGDSLTLRPEITAVLVRAAISNGLLHNQKHRIWTSGPAFRYERPQKGRYRQFHQIDCEALGYEGPDVDAEMILLSARLWRALGIERVALQINSLGTHESRRVYRDLLVAYFEAHRDGLDEDSLRRLGGNPMRILDSKNPAMRELIAGAPQIAEHLDGESRAHFEGLQRHLDACGVAYTVNPRLVRGLDYYTRTVFEWTTDALGAQDAVCSGGRYDGLVAQLGLAVVEQWRDALAGLRIAVHLGGGSFKSQLKRADRSGAGLAVIMGDDEVDRQSAAIKPLRSDSQQEECAWTDVPARVRAMLS